MTLKNLQKVILIIIPILVLISVIFILFHAQNYGSKPTASTSATCPTNVSIPLKHGIFIFNKNKCIWEPIKVRQYWTPEKDGIYLLVFMQEWCGACHVYEPTFSKYVLEHMNSKITYVAICLGKGWKPGDSVEKTFYRWGIKATPTTILVKVENGKTSRTSIFEGVMSYEKLDNFIKKFLESG